MNDPRIAAFLTDADPEIVTEAARAIYDEPIAGAEKQLAGTLDNYLQMKKTSPAGQATNDALMRRLLAANYRAGGDEHAERIMQFLQHDAGSISSRQEAAFMLSAWNKPSPLDRVVELREPIIDLLSTYEIESGTEVLQRWVLEANQKTSTRIAALRLLSAQDAPQTAALLESTLTDEDPEVRIAAGAILAQRHPDRAATLLVPLIENSSSQTEKQKALAALAQVPTKEVDDAFIDWLTRLVEGTFPDALQLDLIEAAAQRKNPQIEEKLKVYRESFPPSDSLAPYRTALHGGSYTRGRE